MNPAKCERCQSKRCDDISEDCYIFVKKMGPAKNVDRHVSNGSIKKREDRRIFDMVQDMPKVRMVIFLSI